MTPNVPPQRTPESLVERSANARREDALRHDRAVLVVAGRAVDARDCRTLLEMLGLDAGRAPRD